MAICPAGHTSQSTDYCDTCGAPMGEQAVPGPAAPTTPGPDGAGVPAGPAANAPQPCPNCGSMNPHDALFCEACGYDYTTGTLPRAAAQAADLLSIDTPVPAPAEQRQSPAVQPAPAAPEQVPLEHQPALLESQPGAASDTGAAGHTPATEAEAQADASGEGMAEAPADAGESPSPAEPPAAAADPAEAHAPAQVTGSGPVESAGPVEWVAEVWVDPEWYRVQQSSEVMPSPGLPDVVPLRGRQALIGRVSQSRNIHPEIDCGADTGVSRRQAQLSTDGQRWFIEDLESANGTYVGGMGEPLPDDPIQGRRELADDDRVYVGAWTRVVLRKATPDERAAFTG